MKKIRLLVVLILVVFAKIATAQAPNISASLLNTLYTKALNAQLNLALSSGYKYIELNENTTRIKSAISNPIFKFLDYGALSKIAVKEKKSLQLYRIVHQVIAKDTIDVNFGQVSFRTRNGIFFHKQIGFHFKRNEISIACGGINGYQPDVRFVFDAATNRWQMTKNTFAHAD
jgi:hypothetical protein